MAIRAGNLGDTTDSMAAEIQQEFERLWLQVYGHPLPGARGRERQIIFVAITRGILKYLGRKEGGFGAHAEGEHLFSRITVATPARPHVGQTFLIRDLEWNVSDLPAGD